MRVEKHAQRIERHAEFYRGYLADDRSLAPVAGVLVTATAIWLLFYLLSLVGPTPNRDALRAGFGANDRARATEVVQRERPHAEIGRPTPR